MTSHFKLILATVVNPAFVATLLAAGTEDYAINLLLTLATALLQAFALMEVTSSENGLSRWGATWRLALIFYGFTFFQSGIEALLFLSYMQSTMTGADLAAMFLFGLVTTVVTVPVAVALFHRGQSPQQAPLLFTGQKAIFRMALLSVGYVAVYFLFGALVFKPLAGAQFDAYYGSLQIPDWLVPFQVLRGLIWVLLAYWLMTLVAGDKKRIIYLCIIFITLPFSSLLLPANAVMPLDIRMAHLVEIVTSMALFGYLCARFLVQASPAEATDIA